MAVLTKTQKVMYDSFSTRAGMALWNTLGPKTKKRIIISGLEIVVGAAARKVLKKSGIVLLAGAIIAGAIFLANSNDDDMK